jgi:hypothetical protein
MLLGAEEFGSRDLLEDAERYVRAAASGYAFLIELESQRPKSDDLVRFGPGNRFLTDEIEMRAAVLRARLDRTARAMAQAEAVLREKQRPYYDELGNYAFTGGPEFCDIASDFDRGGEIEAACKALDEPHEQVFNYLRARTMLDLVTGEDDPDRSDSSYVSAIEFLAAERLGEQSYDRSRCCWYSTEEDLLSLHLARAQYEERMFRSLGTRHQDYSGHVKAALQELQAAERLAAPYQAPGRFRRIAEAWLDARRRWIAWLPERNRRETEEPAVMQYAAYLERTLVQLDAIARGQGIGVTAPARSTPRTARPAS